jgi:NAD(P)-dependent dehydrogenase (short-subunit alcohol dehydrogenase family)
MTVSVDHACAHFEILDRIHMYCYAIDRRRWDLMAAVFHADAIEQFLSIHGGWKTFVDEAKAFIDPMIQTHHQVSNTIVRFDEGTAYCETYPRAYDVVDESFPSGPFLSLDDGGIVWVCGRWRIAHRHGVVDVTSYQGNLSDLASIDALARAVEKNIGTLDGRLDNAAPVTDNGGKGYDEIDLETWDRVTTINVRGGRLGDLASDTALWARPTRLNMSASSVR